MLVSSTNMAVIVSSDNVKTAVHNKKRIGPKTLPCGTSALILNIFALVFDQKVLLLNV